MERAKWIDRKFTFDCPVGWLPNIMERLLGTAVRLNALTAEVNDVVAAKSTEGRWSIKQHIGHLIDLEELHAGRLSDFIASRPELRPADMDNIQTRETSHNSKGLQKLINDFNRERRIFVDMLKALDDDVHQRSALHPRLRVQMRPVDVAFFTAEHDDHHLATIRQLILQLRK